MTDKLSLTVDHLRKTHKIKPEPASNEHWPLRWIGPQEWGRKGSHGGIEIKGSEYPLWFEPFDPVGVPPVVPDSRASQRSGDQSSSRYSPY